MERPKEYHKYTKEDIYNIIASYETTGNYELTAKELGFPPSSVKDIYLSNIEKEEFVEFRAKKKAEFNEKASKIIQKAMNRLEKELDSEKPIPVNNLSTVIGTLHDKMNMTTNVVQVGTPQIEIKVVDNSNLEKVMYSNEED